MSNYFIEIEGFDVIKDYYVTEGYYITANDRQDALNQAAARFSEEHEDCQDIEIGVYLQNSYGIT